MVRACESVCAGESASAAESACACFRAECLCVLEGIGEGRRGRAFDSGPACGEGGLRGKELLLF